jgi:hypothetical protein
MLTDAVIARINNNPDLFQVVLEQVEAFSPPESFEQRLEALGIRDVKDSRLESLRIAHGLGASPDALLRLAGARKLRRRPTVDVPLKYRHSWARLGSGDWVEWGEVDGYRAVLHAPGKWVVCSSDGFNQEKRTTWEVEHVQVGDETWTIAN